MSGASSTRESFRRLVLIGAALIYSAIAVLALVFPTRLASFCGYTLRTVGAHNEFRAIYLGLFLGQAVLMLWAARRMDLPVLADVAAMLTLAQPCGRIVSLVFDGMPGRNHWLLFAIEAGGGLLILLVRPKATAGTQDARATQA